MTLQTFTTNHEAIISSNDSFLVFSYIAALHYIFTVFLTFAFWRSGRVYPLCAHRVFIYTSIVEIKLFNLSYSNCIYKYYERYLMNYYYYLIVLVLVVVRKSVNSRSSLWSLIFFTRILSIGGYFADSKSGCYRCLSWTVFIMLLIRTSCNRQGRVLEERLHVRFGCSWNRKKNAKINRRRCFISIDEKYYTQSSREQ